MKTLRKAFKYRLYPTKAQTAVLDEMLETHRLLYNRALAERKEVYETQKRSVTYYEQTKALTVDRKGHTYLEKCSAQSCQATLKRLDRAFQNFFRRVKSGGSPGYPRFKAYGRFDSITFPQYPSGCKLVDSRCRVHNVGDIKIKLHRPVEGKIKTTTVKHEGDRWYVTFSCEIEVAEPVSSTNPPVGIDLGLKSFLVASDGFTVETPRHYRKAEEKLKQLQRRLSKKKKGSANRKKARLKVARWHRKIANQRRDFHHKTALELVRNHGMIAREDLNVKGMTKNHCLAKSIGDAGWSQFVGILERKAEEAGVLVVAVNPKNTTQRCCNCGKLPDAKLELKDRMYHCKHCGSILDRDQNAAINIWLVAMGREPSCLPVDAMLDLKHGGIATLRQAVAVESGSRHALAWG